MSNQTTPMMQQYWQYRNQLPSDTLLLFRLGDFYEMFFDDAVEGSKILGITLTKRQNYPMAGIPFHSAQTYIPRILASGKKIAICDQVETPQAGKLVKRKLTRILSQGTTLEDFQLDAKKNHFILSLCFYKKYLCISWLDLSTGEFFISYDKNPQNLLPLIYSINPEEFVIAQDSFFNEDESLSDFFASIKKISTGKCLSNIDPYRFEINFAKKQLLNLFKILSFDSFAIDGDNPALTAAGALAFYVEQNLCAMPENIKTLKTYQSEDFLLIDPSTIKSLEIFKSSQGTRTDSLLSAIDFTQTSQGARMLESFLAKPLTSVEKIKFRQNIVKDFFEDIQSCISFRQCLNQIRDIPRILARLQNNLTNPRELDFIRNTIQIFPQMKEILANYNHPNTKQIVDKIYIFDSMQELLDSSLNQELSTKLQDGNCIKEGYNKELDYLKNLSKDNKVWIASLESKLQNQTGIKNLRIKYNGAFGYFIEVSKSNADLLPEDFIRKQTLTNVERFTTAQLKEKEKEIFNAHENALQKEIELFKEIVKEVLKESDKLLETSEALAFLDVLAGFAELARQWDYVCPEVDNSDILEITEARHPVVEQILRNSSLELAGACSFVSNDTYLSSSDEQIALITGPNMAGKSTYIRQIALIALLAHIGSFVPASSCRIGIIDKIFSRIGASDELTKGNSTFMVEMNETANILNNATDKSLIILDEIGRGTSTYDGLSIAWSVLEYLHGEKPFGPKTLFATHYHEITQIAKKHPRIQNYCVSVKEYNDEILFIRKVIKGAADKSYGIQVARLAGLPKKVIDRAKFILSTLESESEVIRQNIESSSSQQLNQEENAKQTQQIIKIKKNPLQNDSNQLSFF